MAMGFYSILIYANWIKLGFDGDELIWIFTRGVTNKAVGVCVCVNRYIISPKLFDKDGGTTCRNGISMDLYQYAGTFNK